MLGKIKGFQVDLGLLPAVNYYHKVLHLGCCSSPRSTSESGRKNCFKLYKKLWTSLAHCCNASIIKLVLFYYLCLWPVFFLIRYIKFNIDNFDEVNLLSWWDYLMKEIETGRDMTTSQGISGSIFANIGIKHTVKFVTF